MMWKSALLCSALATAPLAIVSEQAEAAASHTFVSSKGNDVGTCAVSSPCRTFAFALTQTTAGGELAVLDTGAYGVATITRAVSIVNSGGVAAIQSNTVNAITINAGPNDLVSLRGLDLRGAAGANSGIVFNSGGRLEVSDCVVRRFGNNGILFSPALAATFSIKDTISSDNSGAGIAIASAHGAVVRGVLDRVTASGNVQSGILVDSSGGLLNQKLMDVAVSNSLAENNGGYGFFVTSPGATGYAFLVLRDVTAKYNSIGVGERGAGILLSRSTVTGNGTGANVAAAVLGGIATTGDNVIYFNTVDISGTLTQVVGAIQ